MFRSVENKLSCSNPCKHSSNPLWIPDKVINGPLRSVIDKQRRFGTLGSAAVFEGLRLQVCISDPRFVDLSGSLQGGVEAVKELLDQGADPNLKDNAGWTPLVRLTHQVMHLKALFVLLKNSVTKCFINKKKSNLLNEQFFYYWWVLVFSFLNEELCGVSCQYQAIVIFYTVTLWFVRV